MKKLISFLKKYIAAQNGYFLEYDREIANRNLNLIRNVSITGTIIFILYFLFTYLFFRSKVISPKYILIIPVLLTFFVFANKKIKSGEYGSKTVYKASVLLYMVIMAFVIIMSVFPHPDIPSIYYHLFIIIAPVLFIFPMFQYFLLTVVSLVVFFILVINFKSPACRDHELFEAFTSAVCSVVVIILMTQFRMQTDTIKNKYYALSRLDALTGMMNKATGEASIKNYLASKSSHENCVILFFDIDKFKQINDTFGHLEGDRLLKMVGARLITLCRKNDIVCRFGGDEFIVLLKDIKDRETACAKANAIVEAVRDLDCQFDTPITTSVGVYFGNAYNTSFEDIVHYADTALYTAKKNGRNRYEIYDR